MLGTRSRSQKRCNRKDNGKRKGKKIQERMAVGHHRKIWNGLHQSLAFLTLVPTCFALIAKQMPT